MRKVGVGLVWLTGLVVAMVGIWMLVIGPIAALRVMSNGTTTVWDHNRYPGRELIPSPQPQPWSTASTDISGLEVVIGGESKRLEEVLASTPTLSFLVLDRGRVVYEWYPEGHPPTTAVMSFSITKSILSLMVGAAIEDGLIGAVTDPVSLYLPEMAAAGLDRVSLQQLLAMDSALDYVEDDNPFGRHVKFNYTPNLTASTLALGVRPQAEHSFRYKSGDYAVLGLILDRVLGETTVTGYLQERLWDRLGADDSGVWSTDRDEGLERAWCCLAMTARDLARFGQLVVDGGMWREERLISSQWIDASLSPWYQADRWPAEYQDSPFWNYGYGWWQMSEGAWAAQGKGGQYLYVQPAREIVVVRQGEASGGISWGSVISQVAASIP